MAVSISLSIAQNSQSVANNTSNVTVNVTAKWTGGSWNATGQCTGSITIDGTKYSFSGITFNSGQTTSGSQVIMTKTVNVSHNSDGTKTLSCSASFVTGVSSGTVTCSGSKALTTIPRKSTLSANSGTLGVEQTLAVSRKSSSFTHTITYKCGSASGTICTKSSDLTPKWTPPLSLASQNTTGTSVSVTFTITTYSGSTSIGSNTTTITCAIPASVKPSASVAVSDPTGFADDWGVYIQSKSKLKIVVSASGSQGSTIKAYKVTADGKTYTAATTTTGVIAGSGNLTINVTVTDSRGRTATASTTIAVNAYEPPKITSLSVVRCNADGTGNGQGEYGKAIFSSVIPKVGAQSEVFYTLEYKKANESEYTSVSVVDYDDNFAVTDGYCVFPAEKSSSYDVRLTADCTIEQTTKTATLSSVKKVWSLLKKAGDIVGIAFGKIAELEGVFDVDFVIRARKGIIVDAEWVDLTLADGFALYNGLAIYQPKYKVTGNVVTVTGIVSPKEAFTSSNDVVTIASGIPEELRPPYNIQFVCQGSAMNRWVCSINADGTVGCARYGTTELTTVPTTAWLVFTVTYQI